MSSSSLLNWVNKRSKFNDECDLLSNKKPRVESEFPQETSDFPDSSID